MMIGDRTDMYLNVEEISKGFGEKENRVEVLKDISFSVEKGRLYFRKKGKWLAGAGPRPAEGGDPDPEAVFR